MDILCQKVGVVCTGSFYIVKVHCSSMDVGISWRQEICSLRCGAWDNCDGLDITHNHHKAASEVVAGVFNFNVVEELYLGQGKSGELVLVLWRNMVWYLSLKKLELGLIVERREHWAEIFHI